MHILIVLLVFVVVCAVLIYVSQKLIEAFKVAQPWAGLIQALVVLIVLFAFLGKVGWLGPSGAW